MKKIIGPIAIVAVLLGFLAILLIPKYNQFVNLEETVDSKYAQIDNQLQRRMDLIPNLVQTVKGYASHEEKLFSQIAEARSNLMNAEGPQAQAEADAQLTSVLDRFLVIVENYPDLKANQSFIQLMDELAGTENRIAVARKDYNDVVSAYNRQVKRFPGNLVAAILGFEEKEYFKADPAAEDAPSVDFGDEAS